MRITCNARTDSRSAPGGSGAIGSLCAIGRGGYEALGSGHGAASDPHCRELAAKPYRSPTAQLPAGISAGDDATGFQQAEPA